jgi:hypothetical protein
MTGDLLFGLAYLGAFLVASLIGLAGACLLIWTYQYRLALRLALYSLSERVLTRWGP